MKCSKCNEDKKENGVAIHQCPWDRYSIITEICKCGHGNEYHYTSEDFSYEPVLVGLGYCEICSEDRCFDYEEDIEEKKRVWKEEYKDGIRIRKEKEKKDEIRRL